MKKLHRIVLLILLLCGIMTMQVFAGSESSDEIEMNVMTDKETYQIGEKVHVMVEVTNISDEKIGNVNISEVIPKGLKLADGFENTIDIGGIESGESVSIEFELEKDSAITTDKDNTDNINDNHNDENVQATDTGNNSTVDTGDQSKVNIWSSIVGAALIMLVIIVVLRKKKGKEIVCLFLCTAMCTTMVNGSIVQAKESEDTKRISVSTAIVMEDATYELETIVTYLSSSEYAALLDTDIEEIAKITNDKTGVVEEALSVGSSEEAVTGAKVSYTLKEGNGGVSISDISKHTYFSFVPGAVSVPIDINVIGDEVETATITFQYDRNKLNGVNEDDLGICWYDEENNKVVLLENTAIDKEEQTISVETTHFSSVQIIDNDGVIDIIDISDECVKGDVSGDNVVSMKDVQMVFSYIAGKLELTEAQLEAADVNDDGNVSTNDMQRIFYYVNGKIEKF